MTDIDPVRFGELIQAMRSLEKQLAATTGEVTALEARLSVLEGRWRFGGGALTAMFLMIAFAAVGVKASAAAIVELFK